MPYWDDQASEDSFPSKQTLRTMPSYLGDYEPKSVVLKVPSVWNNKKKEHDTVNLHALISCTNYLHPSIDRCVESKTRFMGECCKEVARHRTME